MNIGMKQILLATLLTLLAVSAYSQTEFSEIEALKNDEMLSVTIGPRPMGSPAEHRALEYAVAKFKEYGCDTAYIMPMLTSSRAITTSGIAVGIKRGKTGR